MARCVDCGMLAQREKESDRLRCVTFHDRYPGPNHAPCEHCSPVHVYAYCSAGISIFPAEIKKSPDISKHYRVAIESERTCGRFIAWVPALLTPKEHMDMDYAEKLKQISERHMRITAWATIISGVLGFLGGLGGAILTLWASKP